MFPFDNQGLMMQNGNNVSETPWKGSMFGCEKYFHPMISRQNRWSSSGRAHLRRNTTTHLFDLVQIRHPLILKSLHAHLIPVPFTPPDVRESTRGVRDGVIQRHPFRIVRFRKNRM